MICAKCNSKASPQSKYCAICGAFLPPDTKKPAKPHKENKHFSCKTKYNISNYYGEQFHYINCGLRTNFNFAAYILFPLHLIYRKCYARFLSISLPILLLWAFSLLYVAISPLLNTIYLVLYTPAFLCPVLYIALAIYNGFTFNKYYYIKLCGNAHVPKNTKGVILNLIIFIIWVLLFSYVILLRIY